ncbi:stage II sporulation protein R [Pseudoflavonifractor sp. DSM 107456]|uniref:Stage II sporulation protein R n=2 Tax=Pseudoflavonifractor TaxID=1017280 RepID=A0ABR9RBQ3_9FIRM|nr:MULTISPECIES: stage II sporulation protein R [Pseudoflavonifractor]MBC5731607.1 stage II sporulation protein R [Pseudoflavonifractor hominis]MBE5056121.1 stage II sporulation protein R [Pseudoflavonifractor gallinarum]MBS5134106.1 stage II sporulation protein R [Oscillospiraceae bacterium]
MKERTGSKKTTLRRWELALLLGVAAAALWGVRLDGEQAALADKVVRLHVLANSDTQEDQALKLAVRDAVLAAADGVVPPGAELEEAEQALTQALPAIADAGARVVGEQGYSYPVTASLEHDVWFPTKEYTDFAFPAGEYTALRVTIGEGGGRNWWCVVFPPLCLGSVTENTAETALEGGLEDREVSLITGEDEGYVVKFKAMELLEEFQGWLEG